MVLRGGFQPLFPQTHEEVMLGDLQEALPPAAVSGPLGSWALQHLSLCSERPAPPTLLGRMVGTPGRSSWGRGDLWAVQRGRIEGQPYSLSFLLIGWAGGGQGRDNGPCGKGSGRLCSCPAPQSE